MKSREDGGTGRRARFRFPSTTASTSQVDEIVDSSSHIGTVPNGLKSETGPNQSEYFDVVEAALADALKRAATAEQWTTVEALTRELESRRRAKDAPNVVPLRAKADR